MRLRPSMRENYRYMLAEIRVAGPVPQPREIYLAASEAFSSIFGDLEASKAWIAVMESSDRHVIFRYRRGMDTCVEAALASVCQINGNQAVIHTIRISGTIRTLRERKSGRRLISTRDGGVKMGECHYKATIRSSGEIDLKEKGINLHIPLYITEEDIEDLYYDE